MESSSSFVQHHEFLDVFLQPSFFTEKAEHHVEESTGKKDRRRAFGGKIETSEFDIKKFECESISHVGFGYIVHPSGLQIGIGILITSTEKSGRDRNENSASSSQVWHRDDNPFPSTERSGREVNQRSSPGKPGARSTESTHRGEVEPPQSRDLKYSILRKSSRIFNKS